MTNRIMAIVEYDGGSYSGFQRQKGDVATVQAAIEDALQKMCKTQIEIVGCGRTDAGVHAIGQVVHFDIDERFKPEEIKGAVNYYLSDKFIVFVDVSYAHPDFHARFDAVSRTYIYRIITRQAPLALDLGRAWHLKYQLDIGKMKSASKLLIGQHNFNSFRSSICQAKSPIKTIDYIEIKQNGDEITIKITARSFLHNMVRIIVSGLKNIGDGRWDEAKLQAALAAEDRAAGPPTAPACGLYFIEAKYRCKEPAISNK